MVELKTKVTNKSVTTYIRSIEDFKKRKDCIAIMAMMKESTGKRPKMWGENMVGYGRYHYKYKSGQQGSWFITGFAPRKQNISIYIMPGFSKYKSIMGKLGKYKIGVSCLYIKTLDDVDTEQLGLLIKQSINDMAKLYECS